MIASRNDFFIYAECSDEKQGRDYKRRIIVMELFMNFVFRIFIEPFNAIISDFELFRVFKSSLIY